MSETTEPKFVQQMTIAEFERLFPNEQACWTYFCLRRWPEGPQCPRCGNPRVYESIARPWHWQCTKCGPKPRSPYRFSLKTKTIFEETKKPLLMWFKVLYLMVTSKKGISAYQIHRMLGTGSYETAWYMCMRLRAAMKDAEFRKLMDVVEVDETFVGGKNYNRHANKRVKGTGGFTSKTGVIGAISRKDNVVCQIIENTDTITLDSFVRRVIGEKIDLVTTDEHSGYRLLKPSSIPHEIVNHGTGEYVRGIVHTNEIESFWHCSSVTLWELFITSANSIFRCI